VLWVAAGQLAPWLVAGAGQLTRAGALALLLMLGGIAYGLLALATGALDVRMLSRSLGRRG